MASDYYTGQYLNESSSSWSRLKFKEEPVTMRKVTMQVGCNYNAVERFPDFCAGADVQLEQSCGIFTAFMNEEQFERFLKWSKGF